MSGARTLPTIRLVAGEIDSRTVATRLLIPTAAQPAWAPVRRLTESLASRGRTLPMHAHEQEEVLTYVIEGFASYQLEGEPPQVLPQGSARLLTAASRVNHRVSPSEGRAVRWVNLVVGAARPAVGPARLQAYSPSRPPDLVDQVEVRTLVAQGGPMVSAAGLECREMTFGEASTTFLPVGPERRAVLYALAGEGSVDAHHVEGGTAALVDGATAVALRGQAGFRAIVAIAPSPTRTPSA
jgi:redox-sensitive bicupin YhaK (pirin superfamily)